MDEIQRKLALIDRQLAGGRDFHRQIISTAPLLFAAVGLMAGIVIQSWLDISIQWWLVVLVLCAVAGVFLFAVQKAKQPLIIGYIALACSVCLGAVRLTSYYSPESNDIRNLVGTERRLATIRGIIVTEPYINRNKEWEFVRFRYTDPASSFYLKVTEAQTLDGWAKVTGTVRVQVAEPIFDLQVGDYIEAYCWLDRFGPATNPGQFDVSKYLARKNVFISASVQLRDSIKLLRGGGAGIFTKVKRVFKETATQALVGELDPDQASRGLLEALLLGYRRDIDSQTYRAFRQTGLLHFISLSGLHLGILVGALWWLCRILGLMKPARSAVCIVAIIIFLMIVPPRAPTLRAAIISLVFCLSFFFRRRSNPANTLSLAAIILLLIRPTGLFEAGWQLSFASVVGILIFHERIGYVLHRLTGDWLRRVEKGEIGIAVRITKAFGNAIVTLFSVGLAAWLGGAGILLYHFYTIGPFTSIWTVVVFPLVAGILTFGFVKIILSFLLPSLAVGLGVVVSGLSDLLIWIVKLIAGWDISEILIGSVSGVVIVFYYGLILFAAFVYFRRPLVKGAICTTMILVIVCFLGVIKWQRIKGDDLVINCLDVGHGQAILVQLPGGANVLFDCGSRNKSDIGRRVLVPFLNYSGVSKVDAIIITHSDTDHINGIPEVVEDRRVGGIYAGDAFISQTSGKETAKFLAESLGEKGLAIKRLSGELNPAGGGNIKILWPSEEICQNEDLSDNDKSVVSMIEFAGRKVLLCSDIEKFSQKELLRTFPNLKADVVIAPHHGSAKTLSDGFLENLGPKIRICSCGRSDYENRRTIQRMDEAKTFFTAKAGAVSVLIDKDGMIQAATFTTSK